MSAVFISSFGLAVIADNRTADEDDLGFELPASAVVEETAAESDLPTVDFEPETDMPFDDALLLARTDGICGSVELVDTLS